MRHLLNGDIPSKELWTGETSGMWRIDCEFVKMLQGRERQSR
jgi:hypothetical protein